MNIALIKTAVKHGAVATNYVCVNALNKDADGTLVGARVKDVMTGKEWDVRARVSVVLLRIQPERDA